MSLPIEHHVRYARMRWLGIAAIVLCGVTWLLDLTDLVYHCPYCRTQRTAIGLLGLLMLLPQPLHWLGRWLAAVVAVLGLVVAAEQHFAGWKKIWAGSFTLGEQWYVNPWLLSGAALFILSGQIMLLHAAAPRPSIGPAAAQ